MIALHTSKLTPLGSRRFALDCGIGALWHSIDGGPLIASDPTLVNVGGIWQPRATPYGFRFGADKSRRIYPDKTDLGRYLHLPMPALLQGLDPVISGSEITFTAPNGRFQVIIACGIQGMSFRVVFNSIPPFQNIKLPVDTTAGLDILALLKATSGLGVPKPRLVDANGVVKPLAWKYAAGELGLDLDFSGLTFPVTLYNTTIDVQVGASANDGYVLGASTFDNTSITIFAGATAPNLRHSFFRFTGITIPQSSTISVAYISLYESNSLGTILTKIYADDQNNPTAVADYNDYFARTLTTAGVDMDGDPGADAWYDSPSIVTVIQELVNSYDYINEAIQIMHKDDGGDTGGNNVRQSRSYDNATAPANTWGPKLHIEYGPAASGGFFAFM